MKQYNVRVDYIVDAETEDDAFHLYMTGKATFDAVYEVEEIHDFDDDIDDEEDEA